MHHPQARLVFCAPILCVPIPNRCNQICSSSSYNSARHLLHAETLAVEHGNGEKGAEQHLGGKIIQNGTKYGYRYLLLNYTSSWVQEEENGGLEIQSLRIHWANPSEWWPELDWPYITWNFSSTSLLSPMKISANFGKTLCTKLHNIRGELTSAWCFVSALFPLFLRRSKILWESNHAWERLRSISFVLGSRTKMTNRARSSSVFGGSVSVFWNSGYFSRRSAQDSIFTSRT